MKHSHSFLIYYMKTIRAKQANVHSTYFVLRDQHGIIAKDELKAKFNFKVTFSVGVVAS